MGAFVAEDPGNPSKAHGNKLACTLSDFILKDEAFGLDGRSSINQYEVYGSSPDYSYTLSKSSNLAVSPSI